jgi:hypothetical protein
MANPVDATLARTPGYGITRYPEEGASFASKRAAVLVSVRSGAGLVFTFVCDTTLDRISAVAIEIGVDEFDQVQRELGCNSLTPTRASG